LGVLITVFQLGSAVASGAAVQLAPQAGRRLLSAGTLLLAAAMALVLARIRSNAQSQPFCWARRAASIRLRAPSFWIAVER
jgi:hypothetical protein